MKLYFKLINRQSTAVILVFFMIFFISKNTYSQQSLTLFHLEPIPENNYSNPAIITSYEWHFGVPGLSSLGVSYGNSGFKVNDLLERRTDDSINLTFENFIGKLKKKNNLSLEFREELINYGMKYSDYYFTFNVSERANVYWNYPKDLYNLLWKGNGGFLGETADFSGNSLKVTHFREYAFGASRELNSQWTVGAKLKFLFGKANVWTKKFDAGLYTDPESFEITTNSNIHINSSVPKAFSESDEEFEFGKYFWSRKNLGLAVDLGGIYKFNDEFTFSASVLDLGFISWKNNPKNFTNENTSWTFEGIDVNDYIDETDSVIEERLENLQDSLIDKFNIRETSDKYKTALTSKVILGATYNLSDIETVGLLVRNTIFDKRIRTSVTASYNRKIHDIISASASYTVINRNITNLGLGFVVNLEPFQIYAATDNIVGVFAPNAVKYYNVQFGMNFVFGEKKSKAAPLMH
ncbi:MAG: DUF5723 family protein [Saprospiraceae bacterium]|nr:DUF5723 family protein [Saprospiraceae bacterium]